MAYPTTIPVRLFRQGEYAVINGEKYVPERTCHNVESGDFFRCSNCGCEIALHLKLSHGTYHALYGGEANFCPNCGRRVKED